jgi:hypothetical protein
LRHWSTFDPKVDPKDTWDPTLAIYWMTLAFLLSYVIKILGGGGGGGAYIISTVYSIRTNKSGGLKAPLSHYKV